MKTNAYQGFRKNIYENGKARVLFKNRVHQTAILLSRQLAMGSWKPEAAALILSLCQGVMATLHSTEFSMESVIRGHHVYKYKWSNVVGEELECWIETGNVRYKLRKFIFENSPKFS